MLYDKIKNYSHTDIYPFHMPGHKRNFLNSELPFNYDLTEINDFDNLHNPHNCIKELQNKIAKTFNVKRAFMLVNGSTVGILAGMRALTNFGDNVLIARNCHKSVYNAIDICHLKAEYIYPNIDKAYNISESILPEQIEHKLINNSKIKLVVITSPTYEGVVSNVKQISDICKKYGAYLLVDEAHGAHFPFNKYFPNEAVCSGADVAVISLHKTLPALTQTAVLLTNNEMLCDNLSENLSVFETSSPSYILMSSIELCVDYINNNKNVFNDYICKINKFSNECKQLSKLKVLCKGNDNLLNHNFFDYDIGKIIISTINTNINGFELSKILREKYKIEIEMAYDSFIIAMTSICDTDKGFGLLLNSLKEIDDNLCLSNEPINIECQDTDATQKFYSFERYNKNSININFENSADYVSLEYVWAYPPGVPLIIPGEVISQNTIDKIKKLSVKNIEIISTNNTMPNTINVTAL